MLNIFTFVERVAIIQPKWGSFKGLIRFVPRSPVLPGVEPLSQLCPVTPPPPPSINVTLDPPLKFPKLDHYRWYKLSVGRKPNH